MMPALAGCSLTPLPFLAAALQGDTDIGLFANQPAARLGFESLRAAQAWLMRQVRNGGSLI
jgi:hypothetical protein